MFKSIFDWRFCRASWGALAASFRAAYSHFARSCLRICGGLRARRMRGPRCGWLRVKLLAPTSQAAALFYGRLFEIAPAVKSLFRGDMTERLQADGDAGRCGQQSWQSRSRVAGGERSCQATRRLWREGSRLHARWRGAAVDAGAEFRITMSEPLVIVGNGMAAACLCEELAQRALGRYAVAVIGEEPRLAYNRVLLSSVLAGEGRASGILLKPAAWWSDPGLTFGYGVRGTAAGNAARTA